MASTIVELFGFSPTDSSDTAVAARLGKLCPFIGGSCTKTLSNRELSGVCTLETAKSGPVICCPIRLYANDYQILKDVAAIAFGPNADLHRGKAARSAPVVNGRQRIAIFGKGIGGELRLPNRGSGAYFVDWILARLAADGSLEDFVAVEVQSIDTTGNYQAERTAHLSGQIPLKKSTAGFNWENVNKRILPQLIYKGNVLQRERKCSKGLFFVCPQAVVNKIQERLGNSMYAYPLQTGSITFLPYELGPLVVDGQCRSLIQCTSFTTSVSQVATAFTSPTNLPDANVYENAIDLVL